MQSSFFVSILAMMLVPLLLVDADSFGVLYSLLVVVKVTKSKEALIVLVQMSAS